MIVYNTINDINNKINKYMIYKQRSPVIGSPCKLCGVILHEVNATKNKVVKGITYYKTWCKKCTVIRTKMRILSNKKMHERKKLYYKYYNRYVRKNRKGSFMFDKEELRKRLRAYWIKHPEITMKTMAPSIGIFDITLKRFIHGSSVKNSTRTLLKIAAWLDQREGNE